MTESELFFLFVVTTIALVGLGASVQAAITTRQRRRLWKPGGVVRTTSDSPPYAFDFSRPRVVSYVDEKIDPWPGGDVDPDYIPPSGASHRLYCYACGSRLRRRTLDGILFDEKTGKRQTFDLWACPRYAFDSRQLGNGHTGSVITNGQIYE